MTLYAISMRGADKTYYAYEYTSSGSRVFDSNPSLTGAKLWKSFTGAEKALRKLKTEQRYLCEKYKSITVIPVEEEEIDQKVVSEAENKIKRNLEHLAQFQNKDVESAHRYKIALLRSHFQAGDSVYLFEKGKLSDAPTTATIDAIDGTAFVVGDRKFDRVSCQEVDGRAVLLPADPELRVYFALYQAIKMTRWEDQNPNVLTKVAEALGVTVHE